MTYQEELSEACRVQHRLGRWRHPAIGQIVQEDWLWIDGSRMNSFLPPHPKQIGTFVTYLDQHGWLMPFRAGDKEPSYG